METNDLRHQYERVPSIGGTFIHSLRISLRLSLQSSWTRQAMVLAEINAENIYIVCGYTDMRKSITGLSAIIIQQFEMRPDEHSMFLFYGKRADRMKALIWEGDGFLLLYKVLIGFHYQWPRNEKEVLALSVPQYHRLLEGLAIEQKRFPLPKDLV